MKTEPIEAVYEHGGLCLVAPADLELAEGQKVCLVQSIEEADDMLALAARVYEGLTNDQIASIEQYMARR